MYTVYNFITINRGGWAYRQSNFTNEIKKQQIKIKISYQSLEEGRIVGTSVGLLIDH